MQIEMKREEEKALDARASRRNERWSDGRASVDQGVNEGMYKKEKKIPEK